MFLFYWSFRPTREFFTHMEASPWQWGAANFDLCSALSRFFGVLNLLWHRASVHNVHLHGPVILILNVSVWQWCCHYPFLRLRSVAAGIRYCFRYKYILKVKQNEWKDGYSFNKMLLDMTLLCRSYCHSASLGRFVPHHASAVWRKAPLNRTIFRLKLEKNGCTHQQSYMFNDWRVWF